MFEKKGVYLRDEVDQSFEEILITVHDVVGTHFEDDETVLLRDLF